MAQHRPLNGAIGTANQSLAGAGRAITTSSCMKMVTSMRSDLSTQPPCWKAWQNTDFWQIAEAA
jgi:hypothetical protein